MPIPALFITDINDGSDNLSVNFRDMYTFIDFSADINSILVLHACDTILLKPISRRLENVTTYTILTCCLSSFVDSSIYYSNIRCCLNSNLYLQIN